jgi:hypothetical protein
VSAPGAVCLLLIAKEVVLLRTVSKMRRLTANVKLTECRSEMRSSWLGCTENYGIALRRNAAIRGEDGVAGTGARVRQTD